MSVLDSLMPSSSLPNLDWITLSQGQIEVIVGLLDHERMNPQPLHYSLKMGIDPLQIWQSGIDKDLSQSINYGEVDLWVRWILDKGQFYLLESALVTLFRVIFRLNTLNQSPDIKQNKQKDSPKQALLHYLSIDLKKPNILPQSVPGLSLCRSRQWMAEYDLALHTQDEGSLISALQDRLLKYSKKPRLHAHPSLTPFLSTLTKSFLSFETMIDLEECLICLIYFKQKHSTSPSTSTPHVSSPQKIEIPTIPTVMGFCPCIGLWTQKEGIWHGESGGGLLCIY